MSDDDQGSDDDQVRGKNRSENVCGTKIKARKKMIPLKQDFINSLLKQKIAKKI